MIFTQTPPQFAPIGSPLRYAISQNTTRDVDIRIIASDGGQVISTKRMANVLQAEFDIAHALRQKIRFAPQAGSTGFFSSKGRTLAVLVEASDGQSGWVSSPMRTYIATAAAKQSPSILSSLPKVRIIAPDESDELTLFTSSTCRITIRAQCGESVLAQSYAEQGAGIHLFRLNVGDFVGAHSLVVDAGECGVVEYTVDPTPHRGARLCWRTQQGSIEHYTFPFEREQSVESTKRRAYGPDGYLALQIERETRTTLRSAFEMREVVEALSEVLCSPQVWRVDELGYTPVDLVNSNAVIHRHDAMGYVEVVYRPIFKSTGLWS